MSDTVTLTKSCAAYRDFDSSAQRCEHKLNCFKHVEVPNKLENFKCKDIKEGHHDGLYDIRKVTTVCTGTLRTATLRDSQITTKTRARKCTDSPSTVVGIAKFAGGATFLLPTTQVPETTYGGNATVGLGAQFLLGTQDHYYVNASIGLGIQGTVGSLPTVAGNISFTKPLFGGHFIVGGQIESGININTEQPLIGGNISLALGRRASFIKGLTLSIGASHLVGDNQQSATTMIYLNLGYSLLLE